jgi:hypothetical protein
LQQDSTKNYQLAVTCLSDHLHVCNNPRTAEKFSRNLTGLLSISKIDQRSNFGKNQITTVYKGPHRTGRAKMKWWRTTEEKAEILGKIWGEVKATAGNSLLTLLSRYPVLQSSVTGN